MSEYHIAARFRGPVGTGNGGYVAGRAAALLGDGPVEVTLRRPVPLDTRLIVARNGARVTVVDAEGNLIVEARPATLELVHPAPPTRQQAEAATRWFLASPYSHSTGLCFVCGTALVEGFGLRVFSGKVEGRPGISAALWRPDAGFAPGGRVAPEFLWAALDCAGAFAFTLGEQPMRTLLGQLTAELHGEVEAGEPCIVFGWQIAREGGKLHAGTAIFGADGGLRGLARALWVIPRPVAS